jgi:hypothetical protein
MGPETMTDCPGEDRQQFTRPDSARNQKIWQYILM